MKEGRSAILFDCNWMNHERGLSQVSKPAFFRQSLTVLPTYHPKILIFPSSYTACQYRGQQQHDHHYVWTPGWICWVRGLRGWGWKPPANKACGLWQIAHLPHYDPYAPSLYSFWSCSLDVWTTIAALLLQRQLLPFLVVSSCPPPHPSYSSSRLHQRLSTDSCQKRQKLNRLRYLYVKSFPFPRLPIHRTYTTKANNRWRYRGSWRWWYRRIES